MIFKGVSRKDGAQLAKYLLSSKNEQVRVLDVRGTVHSENSPEGLKSALKDFDELGKMTRGNKTIFHLALNPNDNDRLSKQDWQYAIHKAEEALGLAGHPRAIVSHLYKGKEHLHVAWSRVDVDNAKCVQLSHCNLKLCQAAREVELDLGLQKTPERNRGMIRASLLQNELRSGMPTDLDATADTQKINQDAFRKGKFQAERNSHSKEQRDLILSEAWSTSTSGTEFSKLIERHGYHLALGKRGIIVVDTNGQIHSIARSIAGAKQKDVSQKFADLEDLPKIEDVKNSENSQPTRQIAAATPKHKLDEMFRGKSYSSVRLEPS